MEPNTTRVATDTSEQTSLLRDWSDHPPVAAARAVPTSSATVSYPVATFVRELVRNSIDNTLQPWSIRSETALPTAQPPADLTTVLSARTVNDLDDDTEFILVDGDLVALPPPPLNHAEQEEVTFESRMQEMEEARRDCVRKSRVRRGVRKIGKWLKRRNRTYSKEAESSMDASVRTAQEMGDAPSMALSSTASAMAATAMASMPHRTAVPPNTTAAATIPTEVTTTESPNRRQWNNRRARRSWRRSGSQEDDSISLSMATAASHLEAPSMSSAESLPPGPLPPMMVPIQETSTASSHDPRFHTNVASLPPQDPLSQRLASVEASFVGTADQLWQHPPSSGGWASAEAFLLDDGYPSLKKDDMYEDEGTLLPGLVRDADMKVDKADAPDFEAMLRRAVHETNTDLEATDGIGVYELPRLRGNGRRKSDGSTVPLSMSTNEDSEHHVHNDMLKVVMVGSNGSDKTALARAIRQSTKKSRKRTTLGVDVHTWTPLTQVTDTVVKFSIWDVQGANVAKRDDDASPNFGAHKGIQSLFFSDHSLYILVWDLAVDNEATMRKTLHAAKMAAADSESDDESEDDGDDEESFEDEFLLEEANRQADRALHADIHHRVLNWVDTVAKLGPGSAILPVVLASARLSDEEVHRRSLIMQRILEEHASRTHVPTPKLLVGDKAILSVNLETGCGVDKLQETLVAIATDDARSVFSHVGVGPPRGTVQVLDIIRRLKQDHKLIWLDHLLGEVDRGMDVPTVTAALRFLSAIGEVLYFGEDDDEVLSRYIILSRKWLVSALSCILRNDLKRELVETRRFMNMQCIYSHQQFLESDVTKVLVNNATSNCPLISNSDANMLWQSMNFMREAADRYSQLAENSTSAPSMFYFLERLLVRYGVFMPLESSTSLSQSDVFFVPSLLVEASPRDVWTYKSSDSWLTTLCHTWLLRDGAASGLMEHLTVALLQDLYDFSRNFPKTPLKDLPDRSRTTPFGLGSRHDFMEDYDQSQIGRIRIHHIMCWDAFVVVKIGTVFADHESGDLKESFTEVFVAIADQSSSHCVSSDAMRAGMHRVIVSGKGQVGSQGRKLWKGGYEVILNSVSHALEQYTNVDAQVVCPECLAHSSSENACTWGADSLKAMAESGNTVVRCMRGHRVDVQLICGEGKDGDLKVPSFDHQQHHGSTRVAKSVPGLLSSVVVVGLWDSDLKEVRNVGSGFVADRKLGLIVTAGHVLFNMDEGPNFGQQYFGIAGAKAVIGVVTEGGHRAVFRYFAEIITDDIHSVDACVLRITGRLEKDVDDEGAGCGDQTVRSLEPSDMIDEKLKILKLTTRFELEENIRILGFNQGGEGVLEKGKHVNRSADFAKGYICKKFKAAHADDDSTSSSESASQHNSFAPREEIVVMCPTISGHSGGPCVNEEGKVVGILSRADPVDRHRCYLVPTSEIKLLVANAKKICQRPTKIAAMQSL